MRFIKITLGGRTIGFSYWDEKRQCAQFEYEPEYLADGAEVSPLTMPLSSQRYAFDVLDRNTFQGLPGMLSDSLPDRYGNKLIDIWLDRERIPKQNFTPLDRLCYVGKRGMGALEYEPLLGNVPDGNEIDVNKLALLAEEISQNRSEMHTKLTETGIEDLIRVGTSAGGMRAKAVIAFNPSTNEVRSGQIDNSPEYSDWLLKFDTENQDADKKGYCRIEYAYHLMTKDCGIDMTECRLLELGERAHFMTRRFDRVGREKIHVQTLCALAHYDYRQPGAYSYNDVFALMRKLEMPYGDHEQLFKRMVFNVIMRNCDDHTKNLSFMLSKNGEWRLSPAYDITYAYHPSNVWIGKHQLSVSGKTEMITMNDLLNLAKRINLKNAESIIEATLNVASDWKSYAEIAGVRAQIVDAIEASLKKNIDAM